MKKKWSKNEVLHTSRNLRSMNFTLHRTYARIVWHHLRDYYLQSICIFFSPSTISAYASNHLSPFFPLHPGSPPPLLPFGSTIPRINFKKNSNIISTVLQQLHHLQQQLLHHFHNRIILCVRLINIYLKYKSGFLLNTEIRMPHED